jgi:hypothetical protein
MAVRARGGTELRTLVLFAGALAGAGLAALSAQAAPATSPKADAPPPLINGHSDLTGVWTNASITNLTRARGVTKLVLTPEEAKTLAASSGNVTRAERDAKPSDLKLDITKDGNVDQAYNAGWLDPGMTFGLVKGEYRTSWIIDTPNDQLPLTPAGQAQSRVAAGRQRDPAIGPESLAPNDRCLIGSRGSGGPGMLNNLYNNDYQIVVSKDAVAIDIEMVHDVRIASLFADKATALAHHLPGNIRPWLGDAVGWWEGDTLVVETLHVNPEQGGYGPIFLSDQGKVTERFKRASASQILYTFEVADPLYYTQTWHAEMSLTAIKGQVYEYACHEGNYAMEGILTGARDAEAAASRAQAAK